MLRKGIVLALVLALLVSAQASPLWAQGDDTPRMAIISAFEPELTMLLEQTEVEETISRYGHTFTTGRLAGNDVVLFLSGVSMVNATLTTTMALETFNITHIVFSGIAGGVSPELNIGDVAVPEQWGNYGKTFYARETEEGWNFGWHETPFGNYGMIVPQTITVFNEAHPMPEGETRFWFPVDAEMYAVAQEVTADVELATCTDEGVCLEQDPVLAFGGNGVSGPTFVDNAEYRQWVWDTFQAVALDMETAAVAIVAYTYDVPYLAFRSLSDLAGGGPGENEIGTFFQLAADNSASVVLDFLEGWAAHATE